MREFMKHYSQEQLDNALDILRAKHPESILNLWEDGIDAEKSEISEAELEKQFVEIIIKQQNKFLNPMFPTFDFTELLEKWDSVTVDLNRNSGMFKFDNVRLRNCALHFCDITGQYYITYKDVTFGVFDIYHCQ